MTKKKADRVYIKCNKCGKSNEEEDSVWIVNVQWPAKVRWEEDGKIGYMMAEMDDTDIMTRIDFDEVVCDSCRTPDVEVSVPTEAERWMKKTKDEASKEGEESDENDDGNEGQDEKKE